MASVDGFRTLVQRHALTRPLSHKWKRQKPTKEDFGLGDCSINQIYRQRKNFQNEKERRVEEEKKKKNQRYVEKLGLSGIVTLLFSAIIIGYIMAPGDPDLRIFGLIFIVLTGFFLFHLRQRIKGSRDWKAKMAAVDTEVARIWQEPFPEEDIYDNILQYTTAVYEYETWEKRNSKSYWMGLSNKELLWSMSSILEMLGFVTEISDLPPNHLLFENIGHENSYCMAVYNEKDSEWISDLKYSLNKTPAKGGFVVFRKEAPEEIKKAIGNLNLEILSLDQVLKMNKALWDQGGEALAPEEEAHHSTALDYNRLMLLIKN